MKTGKRILCLLMLVALLSSLLTAEAVAEEPALPLTWEEYIALNGITDWNWNDAADAIEQVARYAVELYEQGDLDNAYTYAKATYWGYYETTGFERNTMTRIAGRVSQVELAFTNLRKAIKKDNGLEAVQQRADELVEMLHTDAMILSPEGAASGAAAAETAAEAAGGTGLDLAAIFADGNIPLTWEEYIAAVGAENWNWNDAADAIELVAKRAVELYEQGDLDNAYTYAKATYWGYYETTGFERNTMTRIAGRVSQVELAFTNLRKAIKKDNGLEAVQQRADELVEMLHTDAMILSPEGALLTAAGTAAPASDVSGLSDVERIEAAADRIEAAADRIEAALAGGSTTTKSGGSGAGAVIFAGAFGIILREGLEAILIVGAIVAYLIKSGNKKGVVPVYIGSALGVVCSFIMAAILNNLLAKSAEYHMSQEIIEGVAALTAVVVLFWVSNWMVSKSESAAWTNYIESKVSSGSSKGSNFALAFTAWLAVFREGAEVILFYQPMLKEDRPDMVWAGFWVGVAALVVVFFLIRFVSVKLPLKPFFLGTSILMAIMSISFLGAGIKELMEGGVFDSVDWALTSPSWLSWIPYNDTMDVLGLYPLIGTVVPQLILLAITIVTFVIAIRKNNRLAKEAQEKPTEA